MLVSLFESTRGPPPSTLALSRWSLGENASLAASHDPLLFFPLYQGGNGASARGKALPALPPWPLSFSFNGTGQHPMIISMSYLLTQERAFHGINLVAPRKVKEEGSPTYPEWRQSSGRHRMEVGRKSLGKSIIFRWKP